MRVNKFVLALLLGGGFSAVHAENPGIWREPQTGMEFVWIAKACYQMGAERAAPPPTVTHHPQQAPHPDEVPRHEVCLDGFWLGKHEVTRGQWSRIMNPAGSPETAAANLPVTEVNWTEARAFAVRLGAKGERFRLPTEAEWEYACIAGTAPAPYDPDDEQARKELYGTAWNFGSSQETRTAHAVGTKKPNAWGLHDMLGNVWEWVEDAYAGDAYARHTLYNPVMTSGDNRRVIRGGSFRSQDIASRCGERNSSPLDEGLPVTGFRLVREGAKRR